MWLLLREGVLPEEVLPRLGEQARRAEVHLLGTRWAIALPVNGVAVETFAQWQEVERVISAEKGEFPLVRSWSASVELGTWRRGEAPLWIAGPCSVEERVSFLRLARELAAMGVQVLRGGAYKARTSPYSFQGLGAQALDWLAEAKSLTGLPLCVEILSETHLEAYVSAGIDMLQIGARNMDNYWLLTEAARTGKPLLLKRNPQATITEWLLAAEYALLAGAPWVLLCERGIRTFERSLRYTLDVGALPVLARSTALPRIADPSHAAGEALWVEPLGLAALAAGAEGLIVEVHPNPPSARSDAQQQLTLEQFSKLKVRGEALFEALKTSFQGASASHSSPT